MAHPSQEWFVSNIKRNLPAYFSDADVLEIGSLDINGSIRKLFQECRYVGLDIGEGPGVDVVCPGEDFGMPANSFDTVISCEAMEHNLNWEKTWLNMIRLVKESGLVIMTCATEGRRRHGAEDSDPTSSPFTSKGERAYYKNLTKADFLNIINYDYWFVAWSFFTFHPAHDLYFLGVGHGAAPHTVNVAKSLIRALEEHYRVCNIEGRF